MLSHAAALRQLRGFYQLLRCWIIGRRKLSKGKQSQRSQYCTSAWLYPHDSFTCHSIPAQSVWDVDEIPLSLFIRGLRIDIHSCIGLNSGNMGYYWMLSATDYDGRQKRLNLFT